MIIENKWLTVGLITSCHGINGQVKVKSLSDFDERFLKSGIRWLQKENEPPSEINLLSGFKQPGKEIFVVKLEGINTRLMHELVLENLRQNIYDHVKFNTVSQ